MFSRLITRRTLSTLALAALTATAACGDDDDDDVELEPDVASMVVTIGGTDYTATSAGGGFGAQTASVAASPVTISAEFLGDDGEPDPAVAGSDEFELSVAGNATGGALPAGVTFTRTGPFTGTLTVPEGDPVTVFFGLFHTAEEHDDFGPYPLPIERPGAVE